LFCKSSRCDSYNVSGVGQVVDIHSVAFVQSLT
jgi:hypothetical protein